MKISLIPWEAIWLTNIFILIIWLIGLMVKWIWAKKLSLPKTPLFYINILICISVPFLLSIFNYRFDLDLNHTELTTRDHEIVDLRIHTYSTDDYTPTEIYDASIRAIQSLTTYAQPWTIARVDTNERQTGLIMAQVPVLMFVDDLAILISPSEEKPETSVVVTSKARVGKADMGANGRHIKKFYLALDKELAKLHDKTVK